MSKPAPKTPPPLGQPSRRWWRRETRRRRNRIGRWLRNSTGAIILITFNVFLFGLTIMLIMSARGFR